MTDTVCARPLEDDLPRPTAGPAKGPIVTRALPTGARMIRMKPTMSNPLARLALGVPLILVGGHSTAGSAPVRTCDGVLDLAPSTAPELRPGERLEYELTLGGAYMGKLELSVGDVRTIDGADTLPLFGRLRTNAFVSALKPVRGRYQAMVDPQTLAPLGVRVEAQVGEDPRWERVRFSRGGRKVETEYRYRGHERRRAFEGDHPLLEGLSLLHFARRVPLQTGLSACQDILSTRRMWRVHARVLGREMVETPVGPKPAYRVRTVFTRRGLSKARRRPSRVEIDVLLGDIPGRPPLAFEMTQSRLSGRASLVRWKPGRRG